MTWRWANRKWVGDAQRGAVACRAVERAEIKTQWQENHTKTHIKPSCLSFRPFCNSCQLTCSQSISGWICVWQLESSHLEIGAVDRQLCYNALNHVSSGGNSLTSQNSNALCDFKKNQLRRWAGGVSDLRFYQDGRGIGLLGEEADKLQGEQIQKKSILFCFLLLASSLIYAGINYDPGSENLWYYKTCSAPTASVKRDKNPLRSDFLSSAWKAWLYFRSKHQKKKVYSNWISKQQNVRKVKAH